jgi:hypothetical protein
MTSTIGSTVTAKVIERLMGSTGVNGALAELPESDQALVGLMDLSQIRTQNVAPDLAERVIGVRYPAANVYCEKIVNQLREKFRAFSGQLQMAIEIRQSQDRLEGIQDRLELYVDATMQVLDQNRGDWGDGVFYGGGYQVAFGPVKQGGKNFMQLAKVSFEIGVSKG